MRRTLRTATALTLAGGSLLVGVGVAPAYAIDNDCQQVQADTPPGQTDRTSAPLQLLHLDQAREVVARFAPPGRTPVRVAVLDSGVYGDPGEPGPIPVRERTTEITGHADLSYYHGTVVAGLIAGADRADGKPVGIAPDAEIVDVRIFDDGPGAEQGRMQVTSAGLAQGLTWVARHARRLNIRVANVSVAVEDSRQLERAVQAARDAGVVVVAAAGNRPQDGEPFDSAFDDDAPARDEDAADILFPAGYPDVVTVSSTGDGPEPVDPGAFVVKNSRTDVAVPTQGLVSYGLNGDSCVLVDIATSWAAAEVSGVLALLWQRFPDDTDRQIITRLLSTASGTMTDPTPFAGVGVVQPYEALTRPLAPARRDEPGGRDDQPAPATPATAPERPEDLLAGAREDAVWWGLLGGGLLVLTLLLRPVLSRRR